MTDRLTESQQKWHDLAAKHADDFAQRAAQHDAENSYPFENMDALKASGYTAMPIPADMGGGGATLLEICIAQNRPATAQRTLESIVSKADSLRQAPTLGRPYRHRRGHGVRRLTYGRFQIAYQLKENGEVVILGVFHGLIFLPLK